MEEEELNSEDLKSYSSTSTTDCHPEREPVRVVHEEEGHTVWDEIEKAKEMPAKSAERMVLECARLGVCRYCAVQTIVPWNGRVPQRSEDSWRRIFLQLATEEEGALVDRWARGLSSNSGEADDGTVAPCVVCGGIQGHIASPLSLAEVEKGIADWKHVEKEFRAALSYPVWTDLRFRLVLAWVAAQMHVEVPPQATALKPSIRELFASTLHQLAPAQPAQFGHLSAWRCVPGDAAELQVLLTYSVQDVVNSYDVYNFFSRGPLLAHLQSPSPLADSEAAVPLSRKELKKRKRSNGGPSREITLLRVVLDLAKAHRKSHVVDMGVLAARLDLETLARYVTWPLPHVRGMPQLSVEFYRASMFVAGRYNKYCRNFLQSPMIREGKVVGDGTVVECIAQALETLIPAQSYKFCSSGREDMDVRMLGSGRPFYLEFLGPRLNPPSAEELSKAASNVAVMSGGRVAVRDLQVIRREDTARLREGAEEKQKAYVAVVWTDRPVGDEALVRLEAQASGCVIRQKTPVRVIHRRAALTRERSIFRCAASRVAPNVLRLDLVTQAGTYIKEFVHGDLGRTLPNVSQLLGCRADIIQLDVAYVDFDFPPSLNQ